MSVGFSYIAVILIWSTTPLAIKWSGEGSGFLFGVTGRMVLGAVLALVVMQLMRLPFPWHRRARRTYLVAGLGIYSAMLCVYWAAQFIPSGWISVIFGLTPITTSLMAVIWLDEGRLSVTQLAGMLLGVAGLMVIFGSGFALGEQGIYGVFGVLAATLLHSTSSVWVKRLNRGLHGMAVTTGGLMVAAPLLLLTWFLTNAQWPVVVLERAIYSILYLGIVGSVVGFSLYFYILRQVSATRVALITLITPVTALLLGNLFNGELIEMEVWLGTGLILTGLLCFEVGDRWRKRRVVLPAKGRV
ncbi:MAG: DMT family transporter [Gammaproteobacteria bacterium]|nr:DMT family transporter [Gammaproteobacteria bacterium]